MIDDLGLLVFIRYEGPWERLGMWLLAIDRKTNEIRFEVPEGSWRDRLSDWCDRRDIAWRRKWAARWPEHPAAIWERKT